MRIVIDLQGAQTESRFRGIGRYSLALSLAIARNAGEHEIWLVLNAALPASILEIRRTFAGLVPKERIRLFDIPAPVAENDSRNSWRTCAAENIREYFIQQLQPDAVLVTSLFEGYVDDGVTSVGSFCSGANTAVILYDLIPFLNPANYLVSPAQKQCYDRKIQSLKTAGLLLSISAYSRQEAIDALGLAAGQVVNISTATDGHFKPVAMSLRESAATKLRFGVTRKMVMCAPGGFDPRKNIEGLITAYGLLPTALRADHQLVIVSRLGDRERGHLNQVRKRAGLSVDELILPGYVSDQDLLILYACATLFVFPSLHEGFGLPALEAMACGAPVIGGNNTSIPEVIDLKDALFDASSPQSIADKMQQVLRNEHLLSQLREHGVAQAKKFSWDVSAQCALRALERHANAGASARAHAAEPGRGKPRLAFVSPLQPERTGIADYSTEMLPELVPYYDIELITDQPVIVLPPSISNLAHRSVAWFAAHGGDYDFIIYQFGNSPFHSAMFELLEQHPGVVVLHDFYLSGVLAHEELWGDMPAAWTEALYYSHGYNAVKLRYETNGIESARNKFPCNLRVLEKARGVIVHSSYSKHIASEWYGAAASHHWHVIPHLRNLPARIDRKAARAALGIDQDAFVVCSFGFIDPIKLTHRLLDAWLSSRLVKDLDCVLLFIGENHGGDYGIQLCKTIQDSESNGRIRIAGWTDTENYHRYLEAANAGVQLRGLSRGETSGAVLDCMKYGLPTIVNALGAVADIPKDVVWKLDEKFTDTELIHALETLRENRAKRTELGSAAAEFIRTQHDPARCAEKYVEAVGAAYANAHTDLPALLASIAALPNLPSNDHTLEQLAQSVAISTGPAFGLRQLLVDVTTIARNDLQTGIERVVRAQLHELLHAAPAGVRVEPVYLSAQGGKWHYRYARTYTKKLLGVDTNMLTDTPVDISTTDIFYGLDFCPAEVIKAADNGLYANWRAHGVDINFMVYDILPVRQPQFFPEGADKQHSRWLDCVAENADRLICISHTVADDVRHWLKQRARIHANQVEVTGIHLGADITASIPTVGLPADADETLQKLAAVPSFLMVGTIEPRKGHLQTLAAFEQLWRDGTSVNLVIVGSEGWTPLPASQRRTIPQIINKLRHHPELGKRLFWLQGPSDEYLQRVYGASACLVAASEGEGFGLPLIEAARFGLPIVARDLPVFREVAGVYAFYFNGETPMDLAADISSWLTLHGFGQAPDSTAMPKKTWAENVRDLIAVLFGQGDTSKVAKAQENFRNRAV